MKSEVLTRDEILRHAQALVVQDGVSSLTLERVARKAAISKGGLLYHFASKDDLIRGLIARLILHFEEDRDEWEQKSADTPGRRTRAFVNATLKGSWDSKLEPHGVELFAALMAAMATNPELLKPLRERSVLWQQELSHDGIDSARATLARLAADGLWFNELLGLISLSPEDRDQIISEILATTEK